MEKTIYMTLGILELMPSLQQRLSFLLLGQKGGDNRIQIIEHLKERPYNTNQLAEVLQLNYRTIKHHIDVLLEHGLIIPSSAGGAYGEVYFLSPELEQNFEVFQGIVTKFKNLTSSPAFFRNFIEQTHDAVVVIDEGENVIFWNKSAERLLEYSDKEILGKKVPIFNDPEFLKAAIRRVNDKEEATVQEVVGKAKSGKLVDLEVNIDGIDDEDGKIVAFSILARDIGVRKRTEERLSYLNVLLTAINDVNQSINRAPNIESLIQQAADRLFDTSLFIDISIALRRYSDGNLIEIVGHRGAHKGETWRLTPDGEGEGPKCVKSVVKAKTTAIVNGSKDDCAGCIRECAQGRHSTVIIPMKYRNDMIGILCVCFTPDHIIYKEEILLLEEIAKDLTLARTKMLAEGLLAENEERFASAFFAAKSGAWDWNIKTNVLTWSHGLELVYGLEQGDAVLTHDSLVERVHIDDRQRVLDSIDACLRGEGEHDVEYRTVWPDSSIHWIRETGDVVLDPDSKPVRMLAVVSDITRRKKLENELSKALDQAQAIM
ncbi:MAG: PAS domain S-box protein [Methanomassiliicoccales archaeon]|nr:PAS domain S-box protein [Methanomassiliicoccales archaeon]